MRIVGGEHRGHTLHAPNNHDIRPTTDRVREAVFNILIHGVLDFENCRVLDLFAGTGALGLEALSRGAGFCLFIDQAVQARAIIRQNIEALSLTGVTKVFRRNATQLGLAEKFRDFDLVFIDPPYGQGLAEAALLSACQGGWLKHKAVCVVEERIGNQIVFPECFEIYDTRTYGDTQIVIASFVGN
ncbi:MAG: 16S rRNA (guanine(966)-N(2))-methyltransferase RsmD [Pseudomonadota bacterium]